MESEASASGAQLERLQGAAEGTPTATAKALVVPEPTTATITQTLVCC